MSEKIIKWGFIGCGEVTVPRQKPMQKREVSKNGMTMPKSLSTIRK